MFKLENGSPRSIVQYVESKSKPLHFFKSHGPYSRKVESLAVAAPLLNRVIGFVLIVQHDYVVQETDTVPRLNQPFNKLTRT